MATKLSSSFELHLEKSSEPFQRISVLALPQLNYRHGFGFFKKNSGFRGLSVNAVKEEVIQPTNSETTRHTQTTLPSSSKLVLVVGASGGVGQLVVASLLNRNIKSRLLLRDPEKATSLFGNQDEDKLQDVKFYRKENLKLDRFLKGTLGTQQI